MAFCIPVVLAEQLKAAAQRGEIDIAKMMEMTTQERNEMFQKWVDASTAKEINLGFEKAMVSTKQTALRNWAKEVFVGSEEKQRQYKDVLNKIDDLKEQGLLNPKSERAFLQGIVEEKLGVNVTPEEAIKISELADKLQETAKNESEFGTPPVEYFVARREMDNYLDGITPSSKMKVASSIIARGNMLTRLSSPLLNIESNSVQGALQAFSRRIEARRVGGTNNEYAVKFAKFANQVYAKSGYDVTRMLSLKGDRFVRGEDIVTAQGPGLIRKIGRFYEDKIFEKAQGAPDVVFSSIAFSDRANIEASKIASDMKLKGAEAKAKALEIFKDATRIDPKTKAGVQVREQAIADAMYSTYTNKSIYADVALGIRKIFNLATGDARIGDQIMPFVKTTANVIGAGIDMSGVGLPVDAGYRFFKVLNDVKKGEGFTESMKEEYQGFWRTVVQAGLGVTFAYILSTMFSPDDFIGEFPVSEKERQLLALRNATTNSVKIGNKWVSLDYFGPLGASLVGLLYAKKYGKDLPNQVYNYVKGVVRQSAKIPGFDSAYSTIKALQEATPSAGKTAADEIRDMANSTIGFLQSRVTPGILYDLARMTDSVERATNKNDILSKLKNAIPGLRETLPEKKTIFADSIKTEPWYSTLFAGSRIKTSTDSALIDELLILDKSGNLPSITDVQKTSTRVKEFKNQVSPEKYDATMNKFGQTLGKEMRKLMQSGAYKRLDDEKKANEINKLKDNLLDETLKKGGYKKAKVKSEAPTDQNVASAPIKLPKILSMETFRKMNIFNPPKASAKESTTDKDGYYTGEPFRVEPSDKEGYVNFYYPSGAHSEITKDKVEKYKKLVQDNFDWFGVGKYPTTAEDATKFNDKEVARIAMVTPVEGKAEVKKTAPLLQKALKDAGIYSKEVLAYALATTQHETANAMKPVDEGYYNDKKFGYTSGFTGRKQAEKRGYEGGSDYFGRGYVQLTHKSNYATIGKKIGVDLVNNPEKANDPEIAAKILAVFFKEKGIDKLVKEGKITEARRLVNPDQKGLLLRTTYKRYLSAMPDYYAR